MAEVEGRCGRRKQRNPRRKNAVDNEDHTEDPSSLGVDSKLEFSSKKRSCSNEKRDEKHEEKSEDKKENSLSFSNTNRDPTAKVEEVPKGERLLVKEVSNEKRDKENEAKTESIPLVDKSTDELVKDEKKEEKLKDAKEEDAIEKYLNSSDTVVIYPEPVSDQEQDDNSQEDGQSIVEEEYILKCVHCTETFTRAALLRDHMRVTHPEMPIKYQCPKCEETFPLKSHLDKHLALHSPTSQVCKICNKTFANVYRLQRHMISHDESTDLRKFKCPECGKAFKFKHHLKEHIRIHSGEKPFECGNCGKRFSHSGSYSSHMNSKKCWVLNMKNRRIDRNADGSVSSMLYRPVGYSTAVPSSGGSLQSPSPGSYQGQFLKYDSHGGIVPTLYSQPMTTSGFPTAAYSTILGSAAVSGKQMPVPAHHHPPHLTVPTTLTPPLAPPITYPKPPDMSTSPASTRSQISPDVNCNTQLLNLASGDKMKVDIKIKGKDSEVRKESKVKIEVDEGSPEKKVTKDGQANKSNIVCRFCTTEFQSPIEQHQHERYMCKANADIVLRIPGLPSVTGSGTPRTEVCSSPSTSVSDVSRHATPNGSTCDTGTDEDESEETPGVESKKYRMRSLISEEQQNLLKSRYIQNPRPDKAELTRIASEVGFSKRVVQVWFQNMRARDRRHGKNVPYFPNMARFKSEDSTLSTSTSMPVTTSTCMPPYIPIVPQIFTSANIANLSSIDCTSSKFNGSLHGLTCSSVADSSAEMPLDLSIRKHPPRAHHSSQPSVSTASSYQYQEQVLNLSTKSPSVTKDETSSDLTETTSSNSSTTNSIESSKTNTPALETNSRFQQSSIYKYLQQEGLFQNSSLKPPKENSSSKIQTIPDRLALNIRIRLMGGKNKTSSTKSSSKSEVDMEICEEPPKPLSAKKTENGAVQNEDSDNGTESHLVIDEHASEKTDDDDMDNEDDDSTEEDDDEDDEDEVSNADGDSNSQPFHAAHHNLETLAAVATLEDLKGINNSSIKSKRLRRKSWRQVNKEAEEFVMEMDDTASTEDEDGSQRKRRRSWKGHKVDAELGMYACDQCDKMFSKQSSLARHKYEHSGARPFTCEVCTKAFKHKHHLTEHRRLHSGEKPFQCKKCGKRFSHSGSYSQHMNHRYKYCKPSDGEDE